MDWDSADRPQAYKDFKQTASMWLNVHNIADADQHNYIILWSGKEGLRMFNTWGLTEDELRNPQNIWDRFSKQIEPKENFRIHRLEFQRFVQLDTESVDEFYTRCKSKAMKCQFADDAALSERIIEVLISGVKYPDAQKKLLQKDDTLQLKDALDICRTHEASVRHMAQLSHIGKANVDAIKTRGHCKNCGGQHPYRPRDRCPAYGTQCNGCGKQGHWQHMCLSSGSKPRPKRKSRSRTRGSYSPRRGRRPSRSQSRQTKEVDAVEYEVLAAQDQFESISFDTIRIQHGTKGGECASDTRDELFASLDIELKHRPGSHTLKVKVDTGAQGNILPLRTFRRMFPQLLDADGFPTPGSITPHDTLLVAYNGTRIHQYGCIKLHCCYGDADWVDATFFVADTDGPAILGLPTSRALHLITLHCAVRKVPPHSGKLADGDASLQSGHGQNTPICTKDDLCKLYPDRFTGIGRFPGEYHIELKDNACPVVQPPRKYPIQIKEELKAELDRMESLDVIAKVTEPTDWVSSLAFSRKDNGSLRVCLDPQALNKASKRTYHKTPTLEEITHQFNGAKIFSKLDARHGYWSIVLDEESSLLTTFNSPFGRYRFRRLPFGLKVSQDIFQEKMDMILEQCPGTLGIADDVAVFGATVEEHDKHLHNLMHVARKYGLIFNLGKCDVRTPCIKFFGGLYDASGVHPDPDKVQDIHALPAPGTVNELQQFLGFVQYLAPFVPRLADHTDTLRALLRKDSDWQWNESHQKAFDHVKSLITAECTLTYFNPHKPTVVQVDASSKGLGAALLQDGKPIAFASKALTATEQRYANIERELLAVVFGCTRFHTYLYGAKFVVESDHKPLENIQHKSLANTPPRLQRMMLRLQPYDFTIIYKPGRDMVLADAMSRLNPASGPAIPFDTTIYAMQFSRARLSQLKQETASDSTLRPLAEIIMVGWPENAKDLPKCLRHFWSCRDELSVDDGLVIKGDRIVIPESRVSSLAFSRTDNGSLRVCLDPQAPNKASKRTYHKTPTLEEITHQFNGAKIFSKLDARYWYWGIVLDEESSLLTTFNSPFGRYRFRRLPFGLKVSQDIFQEKMDMILEQCPGTLGIADDVAVFGATVEDHDKHLHNLMHVARKYGLIFNLGKWDVRTPCIKFFGGLYDTSGVHPDPDKVQDKHALPAPCTVNELQQFLGFVQYLASFVPRLADHTDTLRALLRKDSDWQ
ncbi:uncharacterized protein LOC110984016 [Acanthaster planci]|uniref:Uncharacterized protein LOC110984016 n=1 Tax=Acanthaster planci TaxID=133434 RepID=A0A8B7Z1L1_ACAPL|nr:uncharacterized protein LOC110984016 [Acanthaster planci]